MQPRVRLGVIGWPVAHSRSPAMQNAALRAAGLNDWRYSLLPVPPGVFTETARRLPERGFRGVNVTVPHKSAALALADEASGPAQAIGAANTLLFEPGGGVRAENTDAPAMIAAMPVAPRGRDALVLGAGGSARAAVWALLEAGAREVRVWNRTAQRAHQLCAELGAVPVREPLAGADILVHCTTSGIASTDPPFKGLPIGADDLRAYRCLVDFVYGSIETPLVRAARERCLSVVDGLDLLVGQGALSFELFTGLPAPVARMREAVREHD